MAQGFLNYVSAENEQYNFRDHTDVMLKGERYRKDVKNFSFTSHTVNQWNSLPKEVRTAPSLNAFKQRIDSLWDNTAVMFDSECNLQEITSNIREVRTKGNKVKTDEDQPMNLVP